MQVLKKGGFFRFIIKILGIMLPCFTRATRRDQKS